jgi:hypothetical protein
VTTYVDPTALAVDILGEALNGSVWASFTSWDGEGDPPVLDVPVGDRRPEGTPPAFVVAWLVNTPETVARGFVQDAVLEVEAWATDSRTAWRLAMSCLRALKAAAGTRRPVVTDNGDTRTRSVRAVGLESGPGSLPPGEEGLERFRLSVSIRLSTRS